MASEGGKYRTEKELEELAEASFPGNREECDALCEDLKDAEEEYDRLVEAGASEDRKNAVLRRIRAIVARRRLLHCGPCFHQ